MNRLTLPLLLLLPGCDGCQPEQSLPDVLDSIPDDATAVWLGQGSGVGVAEVPILTVNEVGAAVPGTDSTLLSGGALTATTAAPDAYGWAWAEITSAVPGAWDVAATSGTFTGTGTAFVTATPDVHVAFNAWLSGGQDSPVAHAGNGVVTARGGELWWAPAAGGAPVRVLALTDDVVGLRATNLDTDGVGDLVVWSSDEAVLLRGRGEGGLSFAAGWKPKSGTVRSFTVALLDDDELPDVLMVTGDADTCTIIWMENTGSGWTALAALDQDFPAFGATAEDLDEDGEAEITLLTGDGLLRRYAWLGETDGWLATTKSDVTLGIAEGAQLFGGSDLDGDLLPEIIVAGPKSDGTGSMTNAISGASNMALIYDVTGNLDPFFSLGVSVADGDGDGNPDLFLSTPGSLYRASWVADAGQFILSDYTQVPDSVSIDAADVSGDGFVDLLVSRAAAVEFTGASIVDDPATEDTDEGVPWKIATPFSGLFDIGLTGDPWVGDFNGDGLVDVVSFVQNGDPAIQAFYGTAEDGGTAENLRAARATALFATDVPLDLAVCGTHVWTLLTSTTGTEARQYTIDGFGVLTLASTTLADGTALACGDFANGSAAVIDAAGTVTWVTAAGVATSEAGSDLWSDLVAVDRDGDGVDELEGCTGSCTITTGDFDGDGLGDLAWSDGVETTASIGGLETSLGFGGAVWAGDADGDGTADIVVQADGVVAAWRGLGGKPGVPWASYIARDTRGRGYTGDLDGNSVPDVFWLGDERVADDAADWTGTLLYAEAPDLTTP